MTGYEGCKIRKYYLGGKSKVVLLPCDPPYSDILELLQELEPNIYGFEWIDPPFEDEDE